MFSINVPYDIVEYSTELVEAVNFGVRGKQDGSKAQQLIGIISQNAVLHKLEMPLVTASRESKEYDFILNGKRVDVKSYKTFGRPRPDHEGFVVKEQIHYDLDTYLFGAYLIGERVLIVCGWLPKDEFIKNSRYVKKGDVFRLDNGNDFTARLNAYHIKNYQLNDLKSIKQLKNMGKIKPEDKQIGLF